MRRPQLDVRQAAQEILPKVVTSGDARAITAAAASVKHHDAFVRQGAREELPETAEVDYIRVINALASCLKFCDPRCSAKKQRISCCR